MSHAENPFGNDADRRAIWDMLVERDIAAFVAADWSMVADDFDEQRFLGIHAHNAENPDEWDAAFPTLAEYRTEWLRQAAETAAIKFAEPLAAGIHRATNLSRIDITGERRAGAQEVRRQDRQGRRQLRRAQLADTLLLPQGRWPLEDQRFRRLHEIPVRRLQAGSTAVASISTLARSSIRATTCTALIVG